MRYLCLVLLCMIVVVQPWSMDYPVNDSWMFYGTVKGVLERGELRISPASSPSQVLHIAWGVAWVALFGDDIGAIKLGACLWLLLACALLRTLLIEEGVTAPRATIAALILMVNPLAIVCAFSYMSDVPYLAMLLLSLLLFARALRHDEARDRWLLWGSLAVAGAYLVRQIGVIPLVPMTLILWARRQLSPTALLRLWCLPVMAVALHQAWYLGMHGVTVEAGNFASLMAERLENPGAAAMQVGWVIAVCSAYLCWFAAPWVLACRRRQAGEGVSRIDGWGLGLGAGAVAMAAGLIYFGVTMPWMYNLISATGIGPRSLDGHAGARGFDGWPWLWAAVTLVVVLSVLQSARVAAWAWAAWTASRSTAQPAAATPHAGPLVAGALLLHLATLLLPLMVFDRYLLPAIVCLLVIIPLYTRTLHLKMRLAGLGVVLFLLFGLTLFVDYAQMNRAMWTLASRAVSKGISPLEIRGTYEWGGENDFKYFVETGEMDRHLMRNLHWMSVLEKRYYLSVRPHLPGFEVVDAEPYWTPLPPWRSGQVILYREARRSPERDDVPNEQ